MIFVTVTHDDIILVRYASSISNVFCFNFINTVLLAFLAMFCSFFLDVQIFLGFLNSPQRRFNTSGESSEVQ